MPGGELTAFGVQSLEARTGEAEITLAMDEDAFRGFYDRTARVLWAYLARTTGDPHAADDLLQEAYYRFIRSTTRFEGEAHRRHYLFRIATNLAHDRRRTVRAVEEPIDEERLVAAPGAEDAAVRADRRHDVRAALGRLKERERQLLWLAYAEGSSHAEVAEILGVKASSVRVLLFRARRRLAEALGGRAGGARGGERHDR